MSSAKFHELFKKYRLKAEYETLAQLGNALAEKGLNYEDSIFSHWQKGTRIPGNRYIIIKLIELFVEHHVIRSTQEADEFLASAGHGYLTKKEKESLKFDKKEKIPFQVPHDIDQFIGRHEIITKIKDSTPYGKVFLIHGTHGVGKTALAIRLAHLLQNKFPDGVLWYKLNNTDENDILLSIAQTFGENVEHIKDREIRAATVRSLLSHKKVLIIFDNSEKQENLNYLLPNSKSATVIITSCQKSLNPSIPYEVIPLQPFMQKELFELFTSIFGQKYTKENEEQIRKLGELVGDLPLCLHILAKQIRASHINLETLLKQLSMRTLSLKELSYEDRNLSLTLQFSYKLLDKQTAKVFNSLGIFEGKDFSIEAVSFINHLPIRLIQQYLQSLEEISLVEPSTPLRYRIHPLVKQFLQENNNLNNTYLIAAKYYENILSNYEKGNRQMNSQILYETDNILGVFKKCYQLQYWDPITNLWNPLQMLLEHTRELDKLRPLAKNIQKAKRLNTFQRIIIGYFAFHLCFWIVLNNYHLTESIGNYVFNLSMIVIALFGGINGLVIAKSWEFSKNFLGKAVACISVGLITWSIGNSIWSYYNIVLHIPNPYPSIADIAFLPSFPLWAIGITYISQAAGTRFKIWRKHGKAIIIGTPIIVALLTYYLLSIFQKAGKYVDSSLLSIQIILNITYSSIIMVMLTLALVIFGLSIGFFGGRYKVSMYTLLFGFTTIYFADFSFYYTIINKTYFNGGIADLIYSTALFFISFGILGFYRPATKEMN
jgi:hypothetical protein